MLNRGAASFEPGYGWSAEQKQAVDRTFTAAMTNVYMWMTGGLAITTIVAVLVASSDTLINTIFGNWWMPFLIFGSQIGLVIFLSARINSMSPSKALTLFFVFAGLMGLTLSSIFIAYDMGSIGGAFGATAASFAALSVVGLRTKSDLTKFAPILMAGLFGLIIASIINIFLDSSLLGWVVSIVGVLVFMGLIVYDTNKIKKLTIQAMDNGDQHAVRRIGVIGALHLYLDFINLMLFILRIMGGRR
ncbi:MAG: Bax inhibitor-1/YccA family protein [Chloroflexi bacterium]|nr:Bax inhibitor-1/YccA family protein [Chloroflexota bacterium]